PMIISLVILIVAFSGFRTYSQYANLSLYERMSNEYNAAILENSADGVDFRLAQEGIAPELVVEWEDGKSWQDEEKGVIYTMFVPNETEDKFMRVVPIDEKKFLYYEYSLTETQTFVNRRYMLDIEKLLAIDGKQAEIDAFVAAKKEINPDYFKDINGNDDKQEEIYVKYVRNLGALHVRDWYRDGNDAGFLWVKNVWYPDVSYNHPIQDYDDFKSQLNTTVMTRNGEEKSLSGVLSSVQYEALTEELSDEKDAANGYFILIILSIGLMVLSQFISMKSQKESNKYQTVDGRGAATQKVMLVVMPLIYAIFAFMYSAAFSIYMVMSSAISIIVTLLSNLILGVVFKKKEEELIKEKYSRRLPWQQNGKNDKKQNKNNSNKRK
ncbi:MAG: YidC/Oxa1 family membrane protein insertase, partial [Clostridiales bacterium]|nr:YidC/Oxa1 family membrane protein insertase [Clostridiales bacterium]